MAIRKNKKFIDPRYFMDEKTDVIEEARDSEGNWKSRFPKSSRDKDDVYIDRTRDDRLPGQKLRDRGEHPDQLKMSPEDRVADWKKRSKYFEENVGEEDLEEGFENVTPENIQIVADAFKQVAISFSPAIIMPALVLLYKELKQKKTDKE
jgi:hypothetical protein|tara:strand:- start:3808 stop:4257 length:450 start_codon:yes stop_codon:yes gene_type:complete